MKIIDEKIQELSSMKSYPKQLYYSGNKELLKRKKISIVGSRRPSKYSKMMTNTLASSLSKNGICIVSGGAMGIDAIAHSSAGSFNTISVLPCGIDIRYPTINKNLLNDIEKNGLLLSQFELGFRATHWSFVVRNELVVALGDVLIVSEADLDSGTMRSIEFALAMGKEIFVLPQRLGESMGTNKLLQDGKAKCIYDVDEFVARLSLNNEVANTKDEFLEYCSINPNYEDALAKYPDRIFEAELSGEILIQNGRVMTNL